MSVPRKCKLIIKDEVNCLFVGIHPDDIAYLYEEYGIFATNYHFNPKFKLGSWDGKIRYFSKTGKTYVNLLEDILPRLIGLKYKVQIDDRRNGQFVHPPNIDENFFKDVKIPDSEEFWKFRNYQCDMVNTLLNDGGGVGIAGTGAGKTGMCAALATAYERAGNLKSIIIVPDKNLTDQTKEDYQFFGLDVGEYSGDNKDLNHIHIVSTWQALQNNPSILQQFDVIIVDEAHGLKGQVLSKLLNEYGKNIAYRFGVTGTLPKPETDIMAVRISVGNVKYEIPAYVLIEQGYLASLHIDVMQLSTNLKEHYQEYLDDMVDQPGKRLSYKQFKNGYFPDWNAEKQFLKNDKKRLQWIADYIELKRSEGKGNVLCLIDGIAFGKKLTKMIEGAVFVYGKDKMSDRKAIYKLFKDYDNLVVIANAQVASTGLNIKRIFNMMFIDIGKSFIRVIQTIGRGLRKAIDKDSVHVTDICSDFKNSSKHLRERIKFYNEARYPFKKKLVDYL